MISRSLPVADNWIDGDALTQLVYVISCKMFLNLDKDVTFGNNRGKKRINEEIFLLLFLCHF